MTHVGKHAIVVGAGMGGLLAARALADHFDEVTVLHSLFTALGYRPPVW